MQTIQEIIEERVTNGIGYREANPNREPNTNDSAIDVQKSLAILDPAVGGNEIEQLNGLRLFLYNLKERTGMSYKMVNADEVDNALRLKAYVEVVEKRLKEARSEVQRYAAAISKLPMIIGIEENPFYLRLNDQSETPLCISIPPNIRQYDYHKPIKHIHHRFIQLEELLFLEKKPEKKKP